MKSFIESLYYGEISPCSMPVPNTKRYIDAQKELGKYETELLTKYPDCKELLEQYADAIHIVRSDEKHRYKHNRRYTFLLYLRD